MQLNAHSIYVNHRTIIELFQTVCRHSGFRVNFNSLAQQKVNLRKTQTTSFHYTSHRRNLLQPDAKNRTDTLTYNTYGRINKLRNENFLPIRTITKSTRESSL